MMKPHLLLQSTRDLTREAEPEEGPKCRGLELPINLLVSENYPELRLAWRLARPIWKATHLSLATEIEVEW